MKVKFGQTLGYVYYEAEQIKASECTSLCRNEFNDIVPHEKRRWILYEHLFSYLRNILNTLENRQPKSLIHIASKQSVDFGIITGWQRLDLSVVQFINKL